MVGILLDQNATRAEGVFVPFFGSPASTSKGLALLALRTGAPVVPVFLRREPDGRHCMDVSAGPPAAGGRPGRHLHDARSIACSRRPSAARPSNGSGCTIAGAPARARRCHREGPRPLWPRWPHRAAAEPGAGAGRGRRSHGSRGGLSEDRRRAGAGGAWPRARMSSRPARRAGPAPQPDVSVVLLPYSAALEAELDAVKAGLRDSVDAYARAVTRIETARVDYERALVAAGGGALVRSEITDAQGGARVGDRARGRLAGPGLAGRRAHREALQAARSGREALSARAVQRDLFPGHLLADAGGREARRRRSRSP